MQILQFFRDLVPAFKKDDVTEQIDNLRKSILDETLEPYKTAITDFGSKPFQAKVGQDFERAFKQYADTPFHGTAIQQIALVLDNVRSNLDVIETLCDKNLAKDVVATGLTYKKAQLLQYIAIADFVNDFARAQLLYILDAEANIVARTAPVGRERPIPSIQWLATNANSFFSALRPMSLRSSELQKALDGIPEINITEDNYGDLAATQGKAKLDPLEFNLIAANWNPFAWIGMKFANRQVDKINKAKNEKRALEFRLEQLRGQARGVSDAKLEDRIEFYENEVDKLAAKIAKAGG